MKSQRKLLCLACGLDLKDRAKDRRVLVSASTVLPLWKEILDKKLCELDPHVHLPTAQLEVLLGRPRDAQHGLICKKCFNAYSKCSEILVITS